MALTIEQADRKRLMYLRGFLISFSLFAILWFLRFFLRMDGLNYTIAGIVILIGLIITVVVQALFMICLAILGASIRKNPALKEALDNEMVIQCELRSWKAAFIASILSTSILAIISFFYPVTDLVFVALTSIIIGAGAYRATFYMLYTSYEN